MLQKIEGRSISGKMLLTTDTTIVVRHMLPSVGGLLLEVCHVPSGNVVPMHCNSFCLTSVKSSSLKMWSVTD